MMLERKIIIILAFLGLLLLTGCLGDGSSGEYFHLTETDEGLQVDYNAHRIHDTFVYRNGVRIGELSQYKDGERFTKPGLYEVHKDPKGIRGRGNVAIETYNIQDLNTSEFDYLEKQDLDGILSKTSLKELKATFTFIGCKIKNIETIDKGRTLVEYQCDPLHYLSQQYAGFIKDKVSNEVHTVKFEVKHGNDFKDTVTFNRSNISKKDLEIVLSQDV